MFTGHPLWVKRVSGPGCTGIVEPRMKQAARRVAGVDHDGNLAGETRSRCALCEKCGCKKDGKEKGAKGERSHRAVGVLTGLTAILKDTPAKRRETAGLNRINRSRGRLRGGSSREDKK